MERGEGDTREKTLLWESGRTIRDKYGVKLIFRGNKHQLMFCPGEPDLLSSDVGKAWGYPEWKKKGSGQ